MLLRLLMFLAEAGIGLSVIGLGSRWLVKRAFSERLERARKAKEGSQRLKKKFHVGYLCAFCNKDVNEERDLYKDSLGWFHEACYKELVPDPSPMITKE